MKRMALLAYMGLLMANGDAEPGQPISPRFAGDPSPHWFDDRWYLYATDDASNSAAIGTAPAGASTVRYRHAKLAG
ncbi:hypothetical protein ACFSUK_21775 [Sphingobium scionense]